MKFNFKVFLIILFLSVALGISACGQSFEKYVENKEKKLDGRGGSVEQKVSIIATGDIMYHKPQVLEARVGGKRKYDFRDNYMYMQKHIKSADIAVGNFESTCVQGRPPQFYPMFNTPIQALTNLKNSGFDILSTVNNHCMDSGIKGVDATIDSVRKAGLTKFGTYKKGEEKERITCKMVKGIKIAFLGYSEMFNGNDAGLSRRQRRQIRYLDENRIKTDIRRADKQGADVIVVYPHWGEEYSEHPSQKHVRLAHKMISWGADLVLGSHPHVLQKVEWVKQNGEKKFICYSMGNSISNQRQNFMNRSIGDTECGVFLKFVFAKKGKRTLMESVKIMPTWVNRFRKNGSWRYSVATFDEYRKGGRLSRSISGSQRSRLRKLERWCKTRLGIAKGK